MVLGNCGVCVVNNDCVGPVEATAIGNILLQAIGMKHLGSLADAREVVRASFEPEIYEPKHTPDWDEAYSRLQKVIK